MSLQRSKTGSSDRDESSDKAPAVFSLQSDTTPLIVSLTSYEHERLRDCSFDLRTDDSKDEPTTTGG